MILAVDPGKTTGLATWAEDEPFMSAQLPHMEFLDWTWDILWTEIDAVVCESYIITAATLRKTRGENWSLEQIGALRWMCERTRGVTSFTLQSPSEAKSFATDAKLRKVGWYKPGQDHANDASRHLLVYLIRHNLFDAHALL